MGFFKKDSDRKWKNSDGLEFFGKDEKGGKTAWYDADGKLDSLTDTPAAWEMSMDDDD